MREILPGVFHWTVKHPKIQVDVSSYYLADEKALLDPLVPAAGLDAFKNGVDNIFLTNRHHYRQSDRFQEKFGCTVWCVESGLHEFTSGEKVKPFRFGETLPGGIEPIEIGVICPDDTALLVPRARTIAMADAVIRFDDGPLTFVPDEYIGENADSVKKGLKTVLARLAEEKEFDNFLLAHGDPMIGGAREALARFAAE